MEESVEFPRKEAPSLDSDDIEFQIVDWYIPEADRLNRKPPEEDEEPDLYNMIVYGTTQEGHTVSMRIEGYEPYFYIKPPAAWEGFSNKVFNNQLDNLKLTLLEDKYQCTFKDKKYFRKIISRGYESHLVSVTKVTKKDFWGFTNNKEFRFIKVTVKSLVLYNSLKYYFQSLKKQGFQMYESNIDPFLRYIHEQNIKPCGWVTASNFCDEENDKYMTRCDYNLQINYKDVHPLLTKNNIAPLLIASFDIECMSSHGDFPVAKKDYRKVAQDLANVAKAGYEITPDLLVYWLEAIYTRDVVIEDNLKINKVFPKHKMANFREKYMQPILDSSDKIIKLLDEISAKDDAECDDDVRDVGEDADDDHHAPKAKSITVKQQNALEAELNSILSLILPPLKGDKIIQIGTTVHRYGDDRIIYKNIITLDTCDAISGADVISCSKESQLLMAWKKLIQDLNPDILTGYNIFGFDMEYIWERAQENGIIDRLFTGFGRSLQRQTSLQIKKLSSSALGENILKYFDIEGTVTIDLFKVMQRDHKLDSYKLDNVAQIFLGDKKDDLKPHEIFEKFEGTSADRCVIAKYCIQDCALVNRLLHKLKILENNMGMGNVCLVPFSYLFMRGQGIKIFSLIAKECMDKGFLIPVIKSIYDADAIVDEDGYEGAVVLEPKEGIYLNDPIVVFDYGSLYPSSMIARNLSHDCYVMDPKYQVDDPNVSYITVSYDIYEGTGDKKRKVDVKQCTFAQYKDGRRGVIADILCMLLAQRKNTRKKMEYQTLELHNGEHLVGLVTEAQDSYEVVNIDTNDKKVVAKSEVKGVTETFNKFEQDVFDALQLAYKITANSLYGQIGAKTSPIYLKDIAACTTATGREMIMLAKDFVETKYNAEVIYGDSVMPYTPLTYRTDTQVFVTTFDAFAKQGHWKSYNNFKPFDSGRSDKEQYEPANIYAWTHKGWSKIRRIIRHKTTKKIYRVSTPTGIVDVTEDHSLLDSDAKQIKPKDCMIGQALLHSQPATQDLTLFKQSPINELQAYVYGQFVASGKCYVSHTDYGPVYVWQICSKNYNILENCQMVLAVLENMKFTIVMHGGMYVLKAMLGSTLEDSRFVEKYRKNCFADDAKIVPHVILNASEGVMQAFKDGYDDGSGSAKSVYAINANHQVTAQTLVVLLQKLGYCNLNIQVDSKELDMIYISVGGATTDDSKQIQQIEVLHNSYYGYVYDIETEEGVFHGGVGNLILKNTDSIFCKFPLKDGGGNAVQGQQALEYAIEIGKHVENNIVSIMPSPQKLNYEKSLYPFILFSKKRYVGNLYENDVNKFKQKSMGIVLKRRDNAPIVKKIYGGIIYILLNKQDLKESIEFLKEELSALVQGKAPISDLVISKSLRASYKDASKIPHKVLADRIAERDPGNKPQVNDRVPFVYIKVPDAKLQGDRIEHPDYIVENNLTPDYLHYITNQIMNPVLQLYALCLSELPGYGKTPEYWQALEESLKEKPIYKDDGKRKHRLDNLKLNMVKELLFDEYIYMLMEPKSKPRAKIATASKSTAKGSKHKSSKTSNEDVAAIIRGVPKISEKAITKHCKLSASISVTKKADTGKILSAAKITAPDGKKVALVWTYEFENEKNRNKISEIIAIIRDMVEFAKQNESHLSIAIKNNKQFVTDYHKALASYAEFENSEMQGCNAIDKAMDLLDLGTIKSSQNIVAYKDLIEVKQHFVLEK
jgi:DNA polymerase elongation subunit (family B)